MNRRVFQKSCGVIPVHMAENGEARILLLNSGQVRNPKATWEFPKGGREEEEREEETALRECKEETGLSRVLLIPGYKAIDVYVFHRSGARIKKWVAYFLALVEDPAEMRLEPDGREHVLDAQGRWYQWLTYDEAKKTLFHNGQRRVLASAWAHLTALGVERISAVGRESSANIVGGDGASEPANQNRFLLLSGGLDP